MASSIVNKQTLFEITGFAIGFQKIAQRGSALGDRFGEDFLDRGDEFLRAGFAELIGGKFGMNAAAEQAFRGVDISDSDDGFRIHDGNLDRDRFVAEGVVEMGCGEMFFQRLRAEVDEKGVGVDLGGGDSHYQAESSGIVKTQLEAGFQSDADVIMFFPVVTCRNDPEAAGHSEVDENRRADIRFEQEIF